uniref:OSJNBb0054B09.16 protein n=1 Tax=Oryza sativa subsp. japonica TaxID=39947 RepID=Q7XW01_ORYSJ|nr:OSJNBb0054B09.16 [Oryza sativa Japonica Group]
MAQRSKARATHLLSAQAQSAGRGRSASAPVNPGAYDDGFPTTEYLVHLAAGTPRQEVQLTLDTGSDIAWTQCKRCPASLASTRPFSLRPLRFVSFASESETTPPCGGGGNDATSWPATTAYLRRRLGDTRRARPRGLHVRVRRRRGIIGCSAWPGIRLWAREQRGLHLKRDRHRWLRPRELVPAVAAQGSYRCRSTPRSSNSGTSITSLPPRTYRAVREEFAAQVKLPVVPGNATDPFTCFSAPLRGPKPDVPTMALHFEGATMRLPQENYVFEVVDDDDAGNSSRIICLAVIEGGEIILGNFQQQNMHVLYDLQNSKLSFVPAQCDQL